MTELKATPMMKLAAATNGKIAAIVLHLHEDGETLSVIATGCTDENKVDAEATQYVRDHGGKLFILKPVSSYEEAETPVNVEIL